MGEPGRDRSRVALPGAGVVLGAGIGILIGMIGDISIALMIVAGAAVGLIVGAVIEQLRQ